MLTYKVRQDGMGEFRRIQEALDSIPYETPATVLVGKGEYKEKLFCDKKDIILIGEACKNTRIVWDDAGWDALEDGKRGTFRSYTTFWDGERLSLANLTIENRAGEGERRGQALAAAFHTRRVLCENVAFLGYQDTLFCAPLPTMARETRGFRGPREYTPRIPTTQVFVGCHIAGTVDFIFGGANALFDHCDLLCRSRVNGSHGYIAAPSTPEGEMGMLFCHCRIMGEEDCTPGSYYLARPWRAGARACFLSCQMESCVCSAGFDAWNDPCVRDTAQFSEWNSQGLGSKGPRAFGVKLTDLEAERLLAFCEATIESVQPHPR